MSKTPIPPEMKQEVVDRDGIDCLRCKIPVKKHLDGRVRPDTIAFDHVWPEHHGGPTIVRNLQVLCTGCNREKGATHADYRTAPITGGAWHPSENRPVLAEPKPEPKRRWWQADPRPPRRSLREMEIDRRITEAKWLQREREFLALDLELQRALNGDAVVDRIMAEMGEPEQTSDALDEWGTELAERCEAATIGDASDYDHERAVRAQRALDEHVARAYGGPC